MNIIITNTDANNEHNNNNDNDNGGGGGRRALLQERRRPLYQHPLKDCIPQELFGFRVSGFGFRV